MSFTVRYYVRNIVHDIRRHKDLLPLFVMTGAGTAFGIYTIFWSYNDTVKFVPKDGRPNSLYLTADKKVATKNPTQEMLLRELGEYKSEDKTYQQKKKLFPFVW